MRRYSHFRNERFNCARHYDKLKRLYALVEDGLTEVNDVLRDRLNMLKADRERAKATLERTKSQNGAAILP